MPDRYARGWSAAARGWFAVLLVAALAATVPAEPAAAGGLDFHQCKRDGHRAFECATMRVPLKLAAGRARATATTSRAKRQRIRIHVERLKSSRDGDGALLALAGGPGQAANDFAPINAEQLRPVFESNGEQFVSIDQRGTGRSGFLTCPAVSEHSGSPPGGGMILTRRCSRELGRSARWYRTADSVADIEKLRRKLGVEKLSLYGVSYGTVVAGQYARTYPERTQSLVLDSVFGGWDPLQRPSFAATPRVLEAFCADRACEGITTDPVGDTESLAARSRQGAAAKVVDPRTGKKRSAPIKPPKLFTGLLATDLNPALRSLWPAALAAARAGDDALVGRLLAVAGAGGGSAAEQSEDRSLSVAVNLATNCADTPNPWKTRLSIPLRKRATADLVESTPAPIWGALNGAAAYGGALAHSCMGWTYGPQTGALTDQPLPDVPALLLEGEVDLRTPISTMAQVAAELPQAQTTIVANQGHSVLGNICATPSISAWAGGDPVPDRCTQPVLIPNQEIPAESLDEYTAPTLPERTFDAVQETVLDDALVMATALQYAQAEEIGGLRAGRMVVRADESGGLAIALRGYSLVPGLRVSGRMVAGGGTSSGRFRVRGRAAASGRLRLDDGELSGRLGDRDFERRLDRDERRRLRAAEEAEPHPLAATLP